MADNIIHGVAFGDTIAVRCAKASNLAYKRAKDLGYPEKEAFRLAKKASSETSEWEPPEITAQRIVIPRKAKFTGQNGA